MRINVVNNKKKLFIVTQTYPYGEDEKTFIEPELECLLKSEVFDITIISSAPKNSKQVIEVADELTIEWFENESILKSPIKVIANIFKYFFTNETKEERVEIWREDKKIGKYIESLFFYIRSQFFWDGIKQKKEEFRDSIIYTYWCNTETLAIAFHKSEMSNVKLVSRIHGYDLYDERTVYGRQPFRKIIDMQLDKLFFIAQTGKDYYVNKMGETSRYLLSRLGTKNNFLLEELEGKQKKHSSFLMVSCSNIIPLKRIELIIDALSEIDNLEIEWVHFGDGALRCSIEERAQEKLQHKGNITYSFMGQVNNEEILSYYKNNLVDCFITTSETEGCPVTIQEAMSYGIPIIGTAVGEIPLMIDGNGVLLNNNPTIEEIARAIQFISDMPEIQRHNMRYTSRKLWEKYFNAKINHQQFVKALVEL